jgi:hypothetical protein
MGFRRALALFEPLTALNGVEAGADWDAGSGEGVLSGPLVVALLLNIGGRTPKGPFRGRFLCVDGK